MSGPAPDLGLLMTPSLHKAYESDLRAYRLRFSRGGAWTGIALVLLGIGLDYSLYPSHLLEFTMARVLCSLAVAAWHAATLVVFRLMSTASAPAGSGSSITT